MKERKRIVILIMFILFAVSFYAVEASSVKDMERKKKNILNQMKSTRDELSKKKDAISKNEKEILEKDIELQEVQGEIDQLEVKIKQKTLEIEENREKLQEAKEEEDNYYEATKERIKIMYEYGNTEYLEVLLESKNTADFFNRLEYLNKLVEYDSKILERLENIRYGATIIQSKLVIDEAELEDALAESSLKKGQLENIRVAKEKELAKNKKDKEFLEYQENQFKKEIASIESRIEELIRASSDVNMKFAGGAFAFPLPSTYSRVSSKFGPRTHPVTGKVNSYHTGTDYPAPAGTPIKACANGRVIFAGWQKAYGNNIYIDHGTDSKGRRILTHYAHCSSMQVKEGDTVVKGKTIIGKVGSTGWSTGNHLHLGLKVGNSWQDITKYSISY